MERLTNKDGLIKGNFNYQAVKEAVEKLYVLENWLEKENNIEKIEKISDLDRFTLIKKEPCKMAAKEQFKPHLEFKPLEYQIFNDLIEIFGGKKIKKREYGLIGQETNLFTDNGKSLYVGDVVVVRYNEDKEIVVEKTTIIVDCDGDYFPMGFKDKYDCSLKRIRKFDELIHKEIYAECIEVILKEE